MRWIACLSASLLAIGTRTPAQQPVASGWTLVEDLRIGADDGPKSFTDVRGIVDDDDVPTVVRYRIVK